MKRGQVQDLLLSPGDNQHFFRRDKTNVTGVEISIEKGGLGLCNLVQISVYIDRRCAGAHAELSNTLMLGLVGVAYKF